VQEAVAVNEDANERHDESIHPQMERQKANFMFPLTVEVRCGEDFRYVSRSWMV
jgi:hypothetical protein